MASADHQIRHTEPVQHRAPIALIGYRVLEEQPLAAVEELMVFNYVR